MRPLTQTEIQNILDTLSIYQGKRLQTVTTSAQGLCLGIWEGRRVLWLVIDLRPNAPVILPFVDLPKLPPLQKTPLQLFLKAHFVGEDIEAIEMVPGRGRVVRIAFTNQKSLELRLIPRATNVIAQAAEKKLSLKPVQELAPSIETETGGGRTLPEILKEFQVPGEIIKKSQTPEQKLNGQIASTRRSLGKVEDEITSKLDSPYRALGEWLVENQSLTVPETFRALVDPRRKLSWNIEECFRRSKEAERKLEGTKKRASELRAQLADLEQRLEKGDWPVETPRANRKAPPAKHARTLHLSDSVSVIAGKSAKDNLDLLRRAQAWDYWLHVKDQPSAHAILFRPRHQTITDEQILISGQWLLKMSLGLKFKDFVGQRFEILVAERRFVTPIKGDRMGRVTYRSERVFGMRFDP